MESQSHGYFFRPDGSFMFPQTLATPWDGLGASPAFLPGWAGFFETGSGRLRSTFFLSGWLIHRSSPTPG